MDTNKEAGTNPTAASQANERRFQRLNQFYSIKGNGVARARIDAIAASPEFKVSVNKLSAANLDCDPK